MRMPLFFLASGLLAAGPLAASWRTLLHKRVAFFLYLYVLWTLIWFAFFLAVAGVVDIYATTDPTFLALALVLPGPGLWFIYPLAVYAVVAKLMPPLPVWLQLGAVGVLSALAGIESLNGDSSTWTRIARYFFFFFFVHFPTLIRRIAEASSAVKVVASAGMCVAAAASTVAFGIRWIPGVAFVLNIFAVAFGVLFATWISRYRVGRPLVALGRNTLQVYLIHVFWVAAMTTGVQHLELSPLAAYTLPVVMTLVAIELSLLTHCVLVRAVAAALFALPSRLAYPAPQLRVA